MRELKDFKFKIFVVRLVFNPNILRNIFEISLIAGKSHLLTYYNTICYNHKRGDNQQPSKKGGNIT